MDVLEYQSREEGDTIIELQDNFIYLEDRERHWKDVIVVNDKDEKNVHDLRCEVYTKDKEELIKGWVLSVCYASERGEHCLDLQEE